MVWPSLAFSLHILWSDGITVGAVTASQLDTGKLYIFKSDLPKISFLFFGYRYICFIDCSAHLKLFLILIKCYFSCSSLLFITLQTLCLRDLLKNIFNLCVWKCVCVCLSVCLSLYMSATFVCILIEARRWLVSVTGNCESPVVGAGNWTLVLNKTTTVSLFLSPSAKQNCTLDQEDVINTEVE